MAQRSRGGHLEDARRAAAGSAEPRQAPDQRKHPVARGDACQHSGHWSLSDLSESGEGFVGGVPPCQHAWKTCNAPSAVTCARWPLPHERPISAQTRRAQSATCVGAPPLHTRDVRRPLGDEVGGIELGGVAWRNSRQLIVMIRSVPSCLAMSTASSPTMPSRTTATALAVACLGRDGAEPVGCQHVRGHQEPQDEALVGQTRVPSASRTRMYSAWAPPPCAGSQRRRRA